MTLFLCGFACAGKTTWGKATAARLSVPFFDTDVILGDTTRLYQRWGERVFREKEREALASILPHSQAIIALGGGTLTDPLTGAMIKKEGKVVYLKCSFTVLYERILKRSIPAYADPKAPEESLRLLAERRFLLYTSYADECIDTDGMSGEHIVTQLCGMHGK